MKAACFTAAVVIAWPGLASALPIAGELHLGGGLDNGSSGDVASYLTLEPSGRIESLHCGWITLGLAGSVELDALAFDRSGGGSERMQGRPDATVHLAPSFGVVHPRLRVRLGPWLLITNRDRRQMTASLLLYGNGFVEWGTGRNRWYLQAYEQVPYASSGSGLDAGLTRLDGYGPFSKVSGSIYVGHRPCCSAWRADTRCRGEQAVPWCWEPAPATTLASGWSPSGASPSR